MSADPAASTSPHPSVNLLLLITGSVAAVKTGLLLDQLSTEHCHVRIAATKTAFHFLRRAQPSKTGIPFQSILTDENEWNEWQAMNDAVVHIELRRWADVVVIVPLDANSLAKIANGLCDNLVTCVMRAWEVRQKPVIVCPAMNTAMWTHPITTQQLGTMRQWYMGPEAGATSSAPTAPPVLELVTSGEESLPDTLEKALFQVVGPVSKRLACGDIGVGGMASVEEIAKVIRHTMSLVRARKVELAKQLQAQQPQSQSETGATAANTTETR